MRKAIGIVSLMAAVSVAPTAIGGSFNNPRYNYRKILDVPSAVDTTESQFSWDGTKILWNEREKDATGSFYIRKSVKYADWDRTTQTISNVVTVAELSDSSGLGSSTVGYAKWSADDQYIAYGLYDASTGDNKIVRYKLSDASTTDLYDPAAGVDWGNFDFYGDNDSVVFWDRNPSHSNYADLYTWDGTTRSQLTDTSDNKEYEPRVFGSDTSQVLFWDGEVDVDPGPGVERHRNVRILNSDGSITTVVEGTDDDNYFWAVWGKDQNHVGVVDHGAYGDLWTGDLLLYEKVGGVWELAEDLTGDGYESESIIFFGGFDSLGSFCFQYEEADGSRDIYFAEFIPEPVTAVCALLGVGVVGGYLRRRRRGLR